MCPSTICFFCLFLQENPFIMIKGSVHQDDIAILYVYAPNNRTLKYMKEKLTELVRGIANFSIILQDFIIPLSATDRNTTQKVSKDVKNLSNNPNQGDCADIYRKFTQ